MNFLALCQRAAQECGVASGTAIQTALPTVVGATGSLGRIVNWVNDAWTDVQMAKDDWDWMRSSNLLGGGVSFQTVAGQPNYPLGGSLPILVPTTPSLVGLPVTPPLLGGLWNNGGEMALAPAVGTSAVATPLFSMPIPTSAPALGGIWNNGGVIAVAPGPNAAITAQLSPSLLTLPTAAPPSGGLWNDGGVIAVAPGPGANILTLGSMFVVIGNVNVPVDSFGKWDRETFRCSTTVIGFQDEMFLDDIPYDTWRNGYMLGAMRNVQTRPVVVAVGPDQSLNLGPPPNGNYTITADYFVAPSVMAADTDIPVGLPTRFHLLIVYYAMMKYAGYESAPEVMQRGASESARMNAQLMAVRAPHMSFGSALA